ncbi:MAG: metal-dependent transcriptional regulator [Clostridia bacterium]|nr:metal-dependent transcriptional regulator [Clostridia bacterium]
MDITRSNEDYLEAIMQNERDGSAKSVDVATTLHVSKAAVSIAMNDLAAKGLIEKESYGGIVLTERGREVASSTLSKHRLIRRFLIGIGVTEGTAEVECCKIEHILSEETVDRLSDFCKKNHF